MSKKTKPMKFCPCRECEVGIAVETERERIIKLLDECVCGASVEKCMTCECNERKIKRVDLIALIKGEQDEDACEPSDSPCVNGWSCQKHRMTIEQLIDFLAEINGENK